MFSGMDQDTYEKWRDILIIIISVCLVVGLLLFLMYSLPGIIDGGAKERVVNSASRFSSRVKQGFQNITNVKSDS